jgi:hypothetical protein
MQRSSVRVQRGSLVQFKSRLGTPERFFPLSETREERGLGEWLIMNELNECDFECMKNKK